MATSGRCPPRTGADRNTRSMTSNSPRSIDSAKCARHDTREAAIDPRARRAAAVGRRETGNGIWGGSRIFPSSSGELRQIRPQDNAAGRSASRTTSRHELTGVLRRDRVMFVTLAVRRGSRSARRAPFYAGGQAVMPRRSGRGRRHTRFGAAPAQCCGSASTGDGDGWTRAHPHPRSSPLTSEQADVVFSAIRITRILNPGAVCIHDFVCGATTVTSAALASFTGYSASGSDRNAGRSGIRNTVMWQMAQLSFDASQIGLIPATTPRPRHHDAIATHPSLSALLGVS